MADTPTTQAVAAATASQVKDVQDNQTNQVLGKMVESIAAGGPVAGLQAILAAIQAKPSA